MRDLLCCCIALALLGGCAVDPDAAATAAALDELEPSDGPSEPTLDGPLDGPVVTDRVADLPPGARAELEASGHPLLLPADPRLLEDAVITSGPHFIAWATQVDGVAVSLHGTNYRWAVGTEPPPPPPTDQVRSRLAVVSENEGIQTATWDELGMAWALDVECEQVSRDARCADDAYVRSLAESLQAAGGAL